MTFSVSWPLLTFLGLVVLAALSGGYFRPGDWYRGLKKPSWNPPDFLFPLAWSVLYAMMAIAAWLVWRDAGWPSAALPVGVWLVQLVLNALWSALFFGLKRMDLALVDVALLWLAIAATIALFWPVSALAALLMVPYLLWVSFAAFLNFTLLRLNADTANAPGGAS